ncbi:MAG: hypothetical protein U1F15_06185 [Burkholderiales bacterium]
MAPHLRVRVEGTGVAAAALAALLARRGLAVALARGAQGPERIVAIPQATVALLNELLAIDVARDVRGRDVTGRCVAWEERRAVAVNAPAFVCDVRDVVAAIVAGLPRSVVAEHPAMPECDWTIVARGRGEGDRGLAAGERVAAVGVVDALPGFDATRTFVAAVDDGWLFAAPHPAAGVALALVQPPERATGPALAALNAAIDALWPAHRASLAAAATRVRAAPWLDLDGARPGRLCVGDSAFAVDPLRGDGVGFAVRGALLAQAALCAIASEGRAGPYLAHYSARLRHAFRRHVGECIDHYGSAWNAPIWDGEIARMQRCRAAAAAAPALRFRLDGLDLVPA